MPRLIRPRALPHGGTIGIAAPAGPIDRERLRGGCAVLQAAGFRVVHGEDVTAREGYLAGSDERRARELTRLVADPEVDAIVCARGGFGCARIVERLDAGAFRAARKPLVGYSDVTTLLLWQRRRAGLMGFHGPMQGRGADADPASLEALVATLQGGEAAPLQGRGLGGGRAEGRLVGGNLVLLAASLGTPWEIDTRGAILLVEEVAEPPYRIDRMLRQLGAAGKLASLAGLGLGAFSDCSDVRYPEPDVRTVVTGITRPLGIPVAADLPFGHVPRNLAWPVGARATIDGDSGEVRVLERGVSRAT